MVMRVCVATGRHVPRPVLRRGGTIGRSVMLTVRVVGVAAVTIMAVAAVRVRGLGMLGAHLMGRQHVMRHAAHPGSQCDNSESLVPNELHIPSNTISGRGFNRRRTHLVAMPETIIRAPSTWRREASIASERFTRR